MRAESLYLYLLNNNSTLSDNSKAQKTLVKKGLAYISGNFLKPCIFSGLQNYKNAVKQSKETL